MRLSALATLTVGLAFAGACGDDSGDDNETGEYDITVCAPENGPFSLVIDNDYLPFEVGMVHVLEGMEAGEEFTRFEVEVLDETETIAGVETRVVQKTTWDEDDALVAIERAYFAQAPDRTVCFYGEDEDVYEDDQIVETESWHTGEDGCLAAIFMPGAPEIGLTYEMYHDEDEVEIAEITHLGEPTTTPAGTFDDTMTVLEDGESVKKYARDIGEIYDDGIELTSY
jgi:hypothetical protein